MKKTTTIFTICLAILACLPAHSQTTQSSPKASSTTVITSLTSSEFQRHVQAMGFECIRGKDAAGKEDSYFTFKAEGYKVAALSTTPDILELYNSFSDIKPTLAIVNEWNRDNNFSHAYVDGDGNAVIENDMIISGGVTNETVEVFVKTFRDTVARWARFALEGEKKGSTPKAKD